MARRRRRRTGRRTAQSEIVHPEAAGLIVAPQRASLSAGIRCADRDGGAG